MVFDTFRKSVLAGIGLMVITGEQIRRTVGSLVEAGKISQEEGEKLVNEFMDMGRNRTQETQDRIRDMVRSAMDSVDIGSRREFTELEARVRSLENRLSLMEGIQLQEQRRREAAEQVSPGGQAI